MTNREIIKKLRDNAELAWASYFYFDLLKDSSNIPRKIYQLDEQGQKIKDKNSKLSNSHRTLSWRLSSSITCFKSV